MLAFTDLTVAIDEPKTARMEQRTKQHVKTDIQLAAALLGVDETTFVTSVAYERARETIRDHERTSLSPADRDLFLAALDAPPAPTAALRDAARRHAALVRNGA